MQSVESEPQDHQGSRCPLVLTAAHQCLQGELHVSKLFSHPNILPYGATFIADNELWVVTSFMAYGEWAGGPGGEGFCVLCQQLAHAPPTYPVPSALFLRLRQGPHLHALHGRHERAGHRLHPAGGAQGLGLHPPHGLRAQVLAFAGLSAFPRAVSGIVSPQRNG